MNISNTIKKLKAYGAIMMLGMGAFTLAGCSGSAIQPTRIETDTTVDNSKSDEYLKQFGLAETKTEQKEDYEIYNHVSEYYVELISVVNEKLEELVNDSNKPSAIMEDKGFVLNEEEKEKVDTYLPMLKKEIETYIDACHNQDKKTAYYSAHKIIEYNDIFTTRFLLELVYGKDNVIIEQGHIRPSGFADGTTVGYLYGKRGDSDKFYRLFEDLGMEYNAADYAEYIADKVASDITHSSETDCFFSSVAYDMKHLVEALTNPISVVKYDGATYTYSKDQLTKISNKLLDEEKEKYANRFGIEKDKLTIKKLGGEWVVVDENDSFITTATLTGQLYDVLNIQTLVDNGQNVEEGLKSIQNTIDHFEENRIEGIRKNSL